jgi:hypothetical protein
MATAVIIDNCTNRKTIPKTVSYPISEITYFMPFRVRLSTIIIEGYSSSNPPGIGIQIIGFSNWII